jgi:hypothetical protein
VEEVSKDFVKRRNGKKAEAAVAELVEVAADGD